MKHISNKLRSFCFISIIFWFDHTNYSDGMFEFDNGDSYFVGQEDKSKNPFDVHRYFSLLK